MGKPKRLDCHPEQVHEVNASKDLPAEAMFRNLIKGFLYFARNDSLYPGNQDRNKAVSRAGFNESLIGSE